MKCYIYTAEATTILNALEKQKQNFIILSDSLSTISSIATTHKPNDVANKIHFTISTHNFNGNAVNIMWVLGHLSIEGNERVDIHAKHIASSTSLDITPLTTFQDTIRKV